MTPEVAVAEGYSFACAHCRHLWQHRQHGAPGCAAPSRCACVLDGLGLPHYRGPLDLTRQCYICGAEPDYLVHALGDDRRLGVCAAHAKYIAQTKTPTLVVLHQGPVLLPVDRLLPRFRYRLSDVLREIEAEDVRRSPIEP